jgi:AcrR family transcriptional regulator
MSRQPTEVRRRQIADAALEIIARDGLGRFTTAAIAAEIGISEGALFRHFRSKAEIVEAAVELIEELLGTISVSTEGDPIDRLGAFFRVRVELMQRQPGVFRVLLSDQLSQVASADAVARLEALQRRSLELVRACLEAASEHGLLRAGLGVSELFLVVQGSALALAFASAREPTRASAVDAEAFWRTLESMLRK